MLGNDVLDHDLALGDRPEAEEARDLDVVGADPVRAAREALDAMDTEDVRPDPLDVRAEGDEKAAEVLDVRLACGIRDDGLALRADRRPDHVLRPRHRRPRPG